jgi:molybdopterin converting factor small subunit
MTVTIRYYARLKEEAGVGQETFDTEAATIDALWADVAARHRFTLEADLIRAAQADEFCSWTAALVPGQLIVFMPPVAGG